MPCAPAWPHDGIAITAAMRFCLRVLTALPPLPLIQAPQIEESASILGCSLVG